MAPATDIVSVAQHPALFGPWFRDPATWNPWFAFLRSLFGLSLSDADRQVFEECTGRTEPPPGGATEA